MFGKKPVNPDRRCGVVIDIGSASVAIGIVVSDADAPAPELIWSNVERCPIAEELNLSELSKRVTTTLANNMLTLGSAGLTALADFDSTLTIQSCDVTVSAPWTYTVPKRIHATFDEPTEITKKLVADLVKTAEDSIMQTFGNNDVFAELGLTRINSDTTSFTLNGYTVREPYGHEVTDLALTRLVSVCQKRLFDAISETHDKIIPKSKLRVGAFMSQLHHSPITATTGQKTYGLIDASGEAIEVGIVIDSHLSSVMHVVWGHYAAARSIRITTQEPLESALARLKNSDTITPAHAQYSSKLLEAISRAAMQSELPSHFYVHCETGYHELVTRIAEKALALLGAHAPSVSIISAKVLPHIEIEESRLALSLAVFHTAPIE